MKIKLTNNTYRDQEYVLVKDDQSEPSPELLPREYALIGHAITMNASKQTITLWNSFEHYIFNYHSHLNYEIISNNESNTI